MQANNIANQENPMTRVVLVVDDHPVNRLLVQTILNGEGWSVVEAQSADEVMALLEDGLRPAAIFMDIRMPRGDGFSATRRIRAWEQSQCRAPVPVIAFTGDLADDFCDQAIRAGMNGHLPKPVTIAQIRAVLATLPGLPEDR